MEGNAELEHWRGEKRLADYWVRETAFDIRISHEILGLLDPHVQQNYSTEYLLLGGGETAREGKCLHALALGSLEASGWPL